MPEAIADGQVSYEQYNMLFSLQITLNFAQTLCRNCISCL